MTTTPSVPPAAPQPGLFQRVRTFLELIKFSHTIFLLPFAFIATFLASRAIGQAWPGFLRLGLIVLCMVFARTYAMTVNRLADRRLDTLNPRTARRPSATGVLSPMFMAICIALSGALFVATAGLFYVFFHNIWPIVLALPVLAWVALYSFTKRFTWMCHFFLGSSLMLGPLAAWIAIAPPRGPVLAPQILFLAFAVLFWSAGFDILYALQDESVDRATGIFSLPARIGRRRALWVSRICHAVTIALLAAFGLGIIGGLRMGILYWCGFGVVIGLLAFEQSLVNVDDISRVNMAFMTVNGVLGVVFATLTISDLLLRWR